MIINTTNFGYAGYLILKGFDIKFNSNEYGIELEKYNENKTPKELKDEYNKSDFKKYNDILRKIIYEFKLKK